MKHTSINRMFFAVAFAICTILTLPGASAEASSIETVDGGECLDGDLNYPVWDSGNCVASVFDISSSYIVAQNANYYYINVGGLSISRSTGEIYSNDEPVRLRYSKNDGSVELFNRVKKQYSHISLGKQFNDAVYILFTHLGI